MLYVYIHIYIYNVLRDFKIIKQDENKKKK